ncbi:hypothetical protein GLW08_10315 [Pontibacillus yanchengensis]|uniref:Uncharacterized protein n=2 Tax=Pontibacillus yanchengensis TaxID=462910 RepID=A0ACC7VHX5_9BACI|nr:hypothetical protein [Pontibacillus yanchengensis]MYL34258.1 hypothetical protein [Pontibacillus yanchengensis]MYL53729.1 hypothetical protein [Pontibacillus yanchengensis]
MRKALAWGTVAFAFVFVVGLVLSPRFMSSGVDALTGYTVFEDGNAPAVNISGDELEFHLAEEQTKQSDVAEDRILTFDVYEGQREAGTFTLTKRTLSNDDVVYFTKWENGQDIATSMDITYQFENTDKLTLNPTPVDSIQHKHDPTVGVDSTTLPVGLLQAGKSGSAWLGRSYQSTSLSETYEDGSKSVLREIGDEVNPYMVEDGNLVQNLSSGRSDIAESWMLWSDEDLFQDEDVLKNWEAYTAEHYMSTQKWLTPAGSYKKLAYSIEPGTELGYGRSIGGLPNKSALERYKETGERFFESMTLNSVAMIEAYRAEKDTKLWKTEYTSTWVMDDYGIHAPYTDTRHNEKLSLFLMKAADTFDVPSLKEQTLVYADHLLKQAEEGNTISYGGDAFLVADYDGPGKTKTPHASLNHALGEAYYLLQAYQQSGKESYLELAHSIRLAIEEIGMDWVREEGEHRKDVWYMVKADHSFAGNDYQLLTLIDLYKNQQAWSKTKYGTSDMFAKLIDSKAAYLERADVDVAQAVSEYESIAQ